MKERVETASRDFTVFLLPRFTTTAKAATLAAKYSSAFAAGRLASIPVSAIVPAESLLIACVTAALVGLGSVVVSPESSTTVELASYAIGAAFASLFPSSINYAKQRLGSKMDGAVLSTLMLSGTAGGVVVPQLAAYTLSDQFVPYGGSAVRCAHVDTLVTCSACFERVGR